MYNPLHNYERDQTLKCLNHITWDEKKFEQYGELQHDQAFYNREGKIVTALRHIIEQTQKQNNSN